VGEVNSRKLEQISVTEISQFRECRRQWHLGTHLGWQLKASKPEFWFGVQMHEALQTYAAKGVKAAVKAWYKIYDREIDAIRESYGGLWEYAEEMFIEFRELGAGMLQNYELFCEAMQMDMKTVQLEQRVWVPILHPKTHQPVGVKLTARMDRLVAIGDDLFIIDYKTGSQPTGKSLELADQPTGYSYVHYRLTSELPAGVIIEGLLKKLPEEPRILQNGTLSTDKRQNTLPTLYKAEMKKRGLMRSAKHLETLEALEQQGWDGYFERESTQRNIEQVLSYENHLWYIVQDMQDVVRNPEKAYPSPSQMRCPRCPLLNVCIAMEDGSDWENILETQYEQSTERRW
jgi:hypothetical protein